MSDYIYLSINIPLQKPLWPKGLPQRLWERQEGKCYHCLHALPPKNETPRRYDVDFHPIPFEDISDNICPQFCLHTADVLDETNLVATHFLCSNSQLYHKNGHRRYCGRTQCFCKARRTFCILWLFASLALGFGCGIVIGTNS